IIIQCNLYSVAFLFASVAAQSQHFASWPCIIGIQLPCGVSGGIIMKTEIFLGTVVAALIGGPGVSPRLPTKAPYYKAPPAYYGWTGCYIGVEGGGAWGRAQTKVASTGEPFQPRFNINGGIAGGEWGCNLQVAGSWVIGYEGDFSWTDKRGTAFDGRTAG